MNNGCFKEGHTPWNKGCVGLTVAWNKGIPQTEEVKKKVSAKLKGRRISKLTEFKKGQVSLRKGKKHTLEARKKMSEYHFNLAIEKHPRWKGGITPENMRLRGSKKYLLWRESVFNRDNFTCKACYIRGGDLEAHHIRSFSVFAEDRYDLDNGITLCVECHKDIHKGLS
jgi:hypothetical protein